MEAVEMIVMRIEIKSLVYMTMKVIVTFVMLLVVMKVTMTGLGLIRVIYHAEVVIRDRYGGFQQFPAVPGHDHVY